MNEKDINIIFFDQLFASNELLVKSICILWYYKAYDIIFIPYKDLIKVKLKLPANGQFKIDENSSIASINCNKFNKLKMILKLSCNLSIIEDNIPQTGSFQVQIKDKKYSIRCAFHPTNYGEGLSLRIINSEIFKDLDSITVNKGLNIIGGRTCSGKTTLMYSSIIKFKGHCITLEDPVEFLLENISQTDVSIIGYEEGIKSALRQNPDLICIGEIRDKISAQSAIKASLTGHTVLATIHINSPENLIFRLRDFDCNFFEEVLENIYFMDNFIRKDFVFRDGKIVDKYEKLL
jgi:general secretion pathway protein E